MGASDKELSALRKQIESLREDIARIRIPNHIVDPAPWGPRPTPWPWPWGVRVPVPVGPDVDPPPFDAARFRVALGLNLRDVAGRILGVESAKLKLADFNSLSVGDVIGIEPGPIVDPAPDDVGRWVRIDPRFLAQRFPWPKWGDPPPLDLSRLRNVENVKLVDAVAKLRSSSAARVKIADFERVTVRDLLGDLIGGPEVDPPPIDYARFAALSRSRVAAPELNPREISAMDRRELDATDNRLSAEINRLESLRDLVKRRRRAKG